MIQANFGGYPQSTVSIRNCILYRPCDWITFLFEMIIAIQPNTLGAKSIYSFLRFTKYRNRSLYTLYFLKLVVLELINTIPCPHPNTGFIISYNGISGATRAFI